jgi:anhydro-N-acetylmuramic acid kinase
MEWVKTTIFPLLESYKNETVEDLLYTYTLHISNQIGAQFELKQKVLATGGGVKNTFLMKLIQRNSAAIFTIPTEDLIDFKEALIFGLLGVLRLRGEVNCLSSVTGANKDHSSGKIFY